MKGSLPPKLQQVLTVFDGVTDMDDRMALLVSYAEQFHQVPPSIAVPPYPPERRVAFCESEAYVWALPNPDGTLQFHFAVENPSGISAKAVAAILEKTLSGAPREQVAAVTGDIVPRIFRQNISMGKGLGLTAIVETVRALASAPSAQ